MVPALVALPLLFGRSRLAQVLCVLVLGLQWYVILMTGGRGVFVSLMAGLAFALAFLPAARRPLAVRQLAGFVVGAVIFAAALYSFEAGGPQDIGRTEQAEGFYLNEAGSKSAFYQQSPGRPMTHSMGHTDMWKSTARAALDQPLTGIGPMDLVCTGSSDWGHPHNFPLQLAVEWGIPVAVTACLLFLALLRSAVRVFRGDRAMANRERVFGCRCPQAPRAGARKSRQ